MSNNLNNEEESLGKENRYGLRLVQADVTLRSASGRSIHDKGVRVDSKTVHEYLPPEGSVDQAVEILVGMGLRIIAKGRITINIAAPLEEFQEIFGVKLKPKRFFPYSVPPNQQVPDDKGCGIYLEYDGGKQLPVPEKLTNLVEVINLATPARFCQSPNPPSPSYFHLSVPDDIARIVDSIQCHSRGFDGSGVKLAMPDQGTFDHPYYTSRGYDITLDESAYDETADNGSHGTAIAANALAVAPSVEFIGIRNGKKITSATAAFQQSVAHNPDVISISWGTQLDVPDLRAAIALAIADGIAICCACGNGGDVVFPSSMPEVISVGGSYANGEDDLEASTYSSSGILAGVDPGRQMPDLTGLVGQEPNGIYITLPCHASSAEDTAFGGGVFPDGDETATDDGWLVASGTSSATPQVAGVACLLIQSDPTFRSNPLGIKQRLMETTIDVTAGVNPSGESSGVGVDNATGHGVVDAYIALNRVDIWIRDNVNDRGLVPTRGAAWVSPDIKVLPQTLNNPDADFDSATHIDRPEFGTEYRVYIMARNRGVDPAANVSVGFYYADPSTFNSFPSDWRDGQSGNPAEGSISVNGNPTNIITLNSIPPNGARVAGPFLWSPPDPTSATQIETEPDGRARGHFCLLARLDCAADRIIWTGGSGSSISMDNNIGMKNLWVIEPNVTFPLLIGHVKEAREANLYINVTSLPYSHEFHIEAPAIAFDQKNLQEEKILSRKTSEEKIQLVFTQSGFYNIKLAAKEKVLINCRVKPPRLFARIFQLFTSKKASQVEITHYADGIQVSGASLQLVR